MVVGRPTLPSVRSLRHGAVVGIAWALTCAHAPWCVVRAQDTFSLVAVDPASGAIVSAGASCLDGDVVPGGARIVSTIVPGVGALHTQSYYSADNQARGAGLLAAGTSAPELVDLLVAGDVSRSPTLRQYAAITTGGPTVETSAFTGRDCAPYAGHVVLPDLVLAGNILLDSLVLARMRTAFRDAAAEGRPLVERALLALEAVAYAGADRRCAPAGISSRSAFLRLALPSDGVDDLAVDLAVEYPVGGRDPIDLLGERFRAATGAARIAD